MKARLHFSPLHYFHPLERLKRKRKHCLATMKLPLLLEQLLKEPLPTFEDLAKDGEYIVLDIETTGLNSEKDIILSMGWVEISGGRVDLASAHHIYINDDSQINPETAVINHITPQMLAAGVSIHDAMMTFFEAAQGKYIVAHGCIVEENFMKQYLINHYHFHDLPLIWLDTLRLEKSMEKAINQHENIDLTLGSTRTRYGLPEYNSHNALADAVSTAELFLAQHKRLVSRKDVTIASLYRFSQ
ncbi:3'-5' exonuclease [Vibrio genomosp. F10]|uniref:DNA polymerase III subunit epsilon n=2 Tax=Vibrio genomosp. F10 TaxID=723171 RepID=A0A1E5BBU7_9VIBR|nr:3'-5' exonuclease [Vibrio genomosp. F10]OEE31234.1 DNA polymerase III subunit epsilon [Vibrio genomosp. F10 str. ZF-129]OEE97441.1 DNA polymerase III subunit epsilon [Vibrio genomosp. F10 str. 9ZC157]OEF04442.1 DNA polymerase III subunit epsilon [Vibrio genomosp. F10 str. 9ZB36]